MNLPRLLVLTDRRQLPPGRTLTETIAACASAGLTHVVFRELDLPDDERETLAVDLLRIPGLVLISARTAVPGAMGMHLAAAQSPIEGFHGRSCHSEDEVRRAGSAAYVMVSPAAPTDSKPGYGPPLGAMGVRRLAAAAAMPAFALGGITPDNAALLTAAGAYGVAVMGSVMRADDPADVVHRLLVEVGV